jgi:hypothetical protein
VRSGGRNRGRSAKTREGGWIECVVSNDGMMVVERGSNVTRRRRGCARGRDGARSVTFSRTRANRARRVSTRVGRRMNRAPLRVARRRALLQRARSADGG